MYEMSRSHLARAILGYLLEHPDAQDTLTGITQWWLANQRIKTRTVIVKQALTDLVCKGFVLVRKSADAQLHYRINDHRLKEIGALLRRKAV
jgi:hypothetical protein